MRSSIVAITAMLTATLVVGAGAPAASAAVPVKAQKLPQDACALLTDAQVATVVPSGTPQAQPSSATQVSCFWQAGTGATQSLALTVDKLTIPAAKAKAQLKAAAKTEGVKPTRGVGNFAYQSSPSPPFSQVVVLVGTLVFTLNYSAGAPVTPAQNASLLAIAKALAKKA